MKTLQEIRAALYGVNAQNISLRMIGFKDRGDKIVYDTNECLAEILKWLDERIDADDPRLDAVVEPRERGGDPGATGGGTNNGETHLRLTLDVHYNLGRTDVRELERVLIAAATHLSDEGLLSGDETEASVLDWDCTVSTPKQHNPLEPTHGDKGNGDA